MKYKYYLLIIIAILIELNKGSVIIQDYYIYSALPYTPSTECSLDIFVKFNSSSVIAIQGTAIRTKLIDIDGASSCVYRYAYTVSLGNGSVFVSYKADSGSPEMESEILYTCTSLDNLQLQYERLTPTQVNSLDFLHDDIHDFFYINVSANNRRITNRIAYTIPLDLTPIPNMGYKCEIFRLINNKYVEIRVEMSEFSKLYVSDSITINLAGLSKSFIIRTFTSLTNSNYSATTPTFIKRGVGVNTPNLISMFTTDVDDPSFYNLHNTPDGYRYYPVFTNSTKKTMFSYFPYQLGSGSQIIKAETISPLNGITTDLDTALLAKPTFIFTSCVGTQVTVFGTNRKIYHLKLSYSPYSYSTTPVFTRLYNLPYLYGFQSIVSTYQYKIYFIDSKYATNTFDDFAFDIQQYTVAYTPPSAVDILPPFIKSVTVTPFKGYQYVVRIRATDESSGVHYISMLDQIIGYPDLVSGNFMDGIYEKLITINQATTYINQFRALAYDRAGNVGVFNSGEILSVNMNTFPENPLDSIINDITGVSFQNAMVNLSASTPVSNKMYITISNFSACSQFPVIFKPTFQSIEANPLVLKNIEFQGTYVNSESRYVVDFTIPGKLMNKFVYYEVNVAGVVYTSTLLKELFPTTSQLFIFSDEPDEFPPTVSACTGYYNASGSLYTIGFKVKIDYHLVPWKNAQFSIVSSRDPYPRIISKDFSDLSNDGFLYIEFEFDTTYNGISTSFIVVSMTIVDDSGHASYYNNYGNPVSPYKFSSFITNVNIDPVTITGTTAPSSLPVLDYITITNLPLGNTLNIGVVNSLDFKIKVKSTTNAPIDLRHIPQLYLTDIKANIIHVSLDTIFNSTSNSADFGGQALVPIGFGLDGILVSISNVADMYMNFAYFSPEDLPGAYGLIPTSFTLGGPTITSTSNIKSLGETLTIYGKGFGVNSANTKVFIENTTSNIQLPIATFHSIALVVYNVPATTQAFDIFVTVNSAESNKFRVQVQIPPTQSPIQQQCPGNPVCGGPDHGDCSVSGDCQCKGNWIGKDCLSQQINIPQPNVSTTDPSAETTVNGTLPDGSQISFRNLISVVELRELNFKNEIQRNFTFTQWLFTNTSTSSTTSYLYATSIDNNSTNVTVSVQWYPTETTITFANEEIRMLPSTMKYTIEISSFDFQSSTNRLQLVMNAQTISDNTDTCVTRTPENQQDSDLIYEYFKLQIDNHSLYGRFIKRALVDFRPTAISNTLLQSTTQNTSTSGSTLEAQQLIGINIPYYSNNVIIDPDFSVLVESNPIDDSNCPSSSKGLTKSQLAGIIIASSVAGLFVILLSVYFIMKKTNTAVEFRYKLRKLGKMSP
ncbi:EGF-like domain-containing protein [Tieghemostelium lacteum]|uniref:EGF-like domain-containing protein n=1 Tax=Tieghemostelium lacteum TaxID=361077 RepID=A0A152A841_TIELA|nr:EGF-like domain-containing protein [Tieghemostelium lacteum]|eukprot:KYR02403.1 EGF-like domain-containing protein [Tieghemostelium lacteum]